MNLDDLIVVGAGPALVAAAVVLRGRRPAVRWSVALAIFITLTAWAMLGTREPQSIWGNLPVVGGATVGAFAGAELLLSGRYWRLLRVWWAAL